MKLPLLENRRDALEKCVYCPKLCRAACPVSNAEPNEAITPWGKMSAAWFLGQGHLELSRETAAAAWACSGCLACRDRCDHKNPVADTLLDARAELFERGVEPAEVRRVSERAAARRAEVQGGLADIASRTPSAQRGGRPRVKLLLGCGYARLATAEGARAVRVLSALTGCDVSLVDACCGYSSLAAGDRGAFAREATTLNAAVAGSERLIVLDPGCAKTLLQDYPKVGAPAPTVELFVDVAHAALEKIPAAKAAVGPSARYHDPCSLGRGLGRYQEPRALLERVLGAPPREFDRAREAADCSGGGGLLPVSRPDASRGAADIRKGEHDALGGGEVVTACAASLHRFRTRGVAAEDLVTYLARALQLPDDE